MLRKKDKARIDAGEHKFKIRQNAYKPVKKNIRYKRVISYQVKGTEPLKFCKTIRLTAQNKKLLGGRLINRILPPEARQPGVIPWLTVFRHTKGNFLVIRCNLIEHSEELKHDDNGKPYFEPRTDFKM